MRVAGLFSGIGGIELGLQEAGHDVVAVGDIDPAARHVLASHFPKADVHEDVNDLAALPSCDVLAAGFPCQDLSQAGRTRGIRGSKSGVVEGLFRLLRNAPDRPPWVVIENVPFMLHLDKGAAMAFLTEQFSSLGYRWAYRVIDTRGFGLPQRRRRVLVLAGRVDDPATVLLQGSAPVATPEFQRDLACGFYWTEGNTGVGWAVDAVPPLKGGSSLGIPSAPAVWATNGSFITPDIRDAERLQGFPIDWTATADGTRGKRWRLVGNAVSVPVARWLGEALTNPAEPAGMGKEVATRPSRWPDAGRGSRNSFAPSTAGPWPTVEPAPHLQDFLQHGGAPLSSRAASGFVSRARRSSLSFAPGFLDALDAHVAALDTAVEPETPEAA